jgi:GTPase SAR1 family protein
MKDINLNTNYFDDNPIPKMVILNKIDLLTKDLDLNEAITISSIPLINGFNIIYKCSMKKFPEKIDNALLRIKTEIIQRINYKELGYLYLDEPRINLIIKKIDQEGRKIKFEVIGKEKVGKTSLERRLLMMPFEKNIFDLNKIDTLKDRSEFNLTYNYQEGKYKLDMIFSKNGDDEPSNVDCYILLYDVGKEETMVLPEKIKNLAKKNNSFIIVLGNKFDDEYPNLDLENEKLKLKKFVEENECESGYIISCKKFRNIKYLNDKIIEKVNFYNNIKNIDLHFFVQANLFYIRIIGDIKTGKTQLLNRLMNKPFEEKYESSRKMNENEKFDEYSHYYDIIDNKFIHILIEVYNGEVEKIIKTDLTKGIFLVVVDMTDEKSLE